MIMDYTFKPIVEWVGKATPSYQRQRSRFASTYKQTLVLLERELRHLNAKQIVIQTHHLATDIRLDGLPKSSARVPQNPGVILSFNSKHGALSYPCDTFTRWEDNLRAIALALEALRTVDRYGVTKTGEQYKGWTALPPAPTTNGNMTETVAAQFVAKHAELNVWENLLLGSDFLESAYRMAARKLHPDAGGNHSDFVKLQQAISLLRNKR
jgi:hypothetical protein